MGDPTPTVGDLRSAPQAGPPPAGAGLNLTINDPVPGGDGPAGETGESTAPWAFDPDDDDDDDRDVPGFGRPRPPAPPAPPVSQAPPNPFGLADAPPLAESIVPDSWFTQPRKPQEQNAGTKPWTPQSPPAPQPPQGPPGAGAMDRTMMDRGGGPAPMGGPHAPMGQGGPGYGPGAPMGQPGPGGPGYGPGPGQGPGPGYGPRHSNGPRRSDGPNKVLIAAASALVTVAIAAVALLVSSSGDDEKSTAEGAGTTASPPSKPVSQTKTPVSPAMKQQATAMNGVLDQSVKTRAVLGAALSRAGKCETLPKAIQGFEQVAQARQQQLQRTRDMKLGDVPNGEQLRTSLSQALQASLDVDEKYLQWARTNQPNCDKKPKPAAAKVPGTKEDNRRATNAKQQFVKLWNPVAKKAGLPERSWRKV